ncbi:Imm27 family immunity protein [Leptospira noguchii]|uniref:Uncharacterized protein n=1 Tax=Leptospira noguchii str. 2001034031 TaxID=1193053 RepID=M6YAP7_9LEPT|nr:Imm27 family immunity protein [Leptospira noguchii]EMO88916.1 hypothetical protein LEP1GSC024_0873 [Leptospira noguchii str. 2001034031]UOG31818.1 Imm27 family immunity protein [Leptospira noguchii]
MNPKINSTETELIGYFNENTKETNPIVERIRYLTENYLIKIKTDPSGWDILYQDPLDKRYWEKVYLKSELHGGGPPSLIFLTFEQANKKYKLK